jgi:hypothetical protein
MRDSNISLSFWYNPYYGKESSMTKFQSWSMALFGGLLALGGMIVMVCAVLVAVADSAEALPYSTFEVSFASFAAVFIGLLLVVIATHTPINSDPN